MSYDLDVTSAIIEPNFLHKIGLSSVHEKVKDWATTQKLNVVDQIDAGVRFLDLRIARKKDDHNPTRAYFDHGLYTVTDVETALKDINGWAGKHSTEILILALSHFKNFDKKHHDDLISSIKMIFGSKLVPKGAQQGGLALRNLWDKKTNVLVTYEDAEAVKNHEELWANITYYYGDTMDPTQLEDKVSKDVTNAQSDYFFICGLNLTLPDDLHALKYLIEYHSLREYTLPRLKQLVDWVGGLPKAHKKPLNIVASDFVTHDDFISAIIQLNVQLSG